MGTDFVKVVQAAGGLAGGLADVFDSIQPASFLRRLAGRSEAPIAQTFFFAGRGSWSIGLFCLLAEKMIAPTFCQTPK